MRDTETSAWTVMFVDEDIKSQEQVLAEFLAADSPGDWMIGEVGEYLYPESGEQERGDWLDSVFDRVEEERRRFTSTHAGPHQITEFGLEVRKSSTAALNGTYTSLPSPVLLLELCLKIANVGDEVTIRHRYASGDVCVFESQWPFGMDWAVTATTPMGEMFQDEDDEDPYFMGELYDQDLDKPYRQKTLTILAAYAAVVSGVLGGLVAGLFAGSKTRR
jgi:hypothetical protein